MIRPSSPLTMLLSRHTRRREFILALGGAAVWSLAGRAQQPTMLRVGFVGVQPRESALYNNFRRRMAELGYQEGRNFTFDYIQTPNLEGYENGYRELAARKVDVFLAVGNERALRAAISAADGRPIVSSPPSVSRSRAKRSRVRPCSASYTTRFRASNATQPRRRRASSAWSRA